MVVSAAIAAPIEGPGRFGPHSSGGAGGETFIDWMMLFAGVVGLVRGSFEFISDLASGKMTIKDGLLDVVLLAFCAALVCGFSYDLFFKK
ncbi:MAG: hypothetical protein ACJ76Y_24830 [Thermoanaerobaculia bacterium]